MKFQVSNKPIALFSFSSLTDIVMLLLIFFLLSSQFVVQTGVKVSLPGSQHNEQTKASRFIVTLTKDNIVYLGEETVALDQLPAKLGILASESNYESLIIRADKDAPLELVIKIIDAAKGKGIEKFTIQTEKVLP